MSRESESRALMFKSKRCVVSAKLTNQSREKGRLNTVAFLSDDNKRYSAESRAYVQTTVSPTGASGNRTNPPMRQTTTTDERRGKAE